MTRWATLILAVALLHAGPATAQDPEETREPFQQTVTFILKSTGSGEGTTFVPKGTRLVIKTIAASCSTSTTQLISALQIGAVARDWLTHLEATTLYFFPTVVQGPMATSPSPVYEWVASSPTHIYADGGTLVTVSAHTSAGDPGYCWATIGGFLVKPAPAQ